MKTLICAGLAAMAFVAGAETKVVEVSKANPRYFVEGATGKTWIPIGCNVCFDRLYGTPGHDDAGVRALYDRWLRAFAANGGNCIRLWGGHACFNVMERPGVFDQAKTDNLLYVIRLCEELNIKVKITFESFRTVKSDPGNAQYAHFFNNPNYGAYAKSMREYLKSPECRRFYLDKARYYKKIGLGDSPAVYCWELWNEINCIGSVADWSEWSDYMLAELKKLFPKQMTVNNLGSWASRVSDQLYDELAAEPGNDFMQIHCYLDFSADFDWCRGPIDVLAGMATTQLLRMRPDRPAILAEVGAVNNGHVGPFVFYPFDKEGVVLHDALFGAFFAGSAGCGQNWHWDHQYIDGNGLWWQFDRFRKAVEGLDPVAEDFKPFYNETRELRLWCLKGRTQTVIWARDKANSWMEEFPKGNAPKTLANLELPYGNCEFDCYLPFEDRHVKAKAPVLPPFRRSIVVRIPDGRGICGRAGHRAGGVTTRARQQGVE